MSIPRKHHYIPKSYLAAWTDDGTLEGRLQVIDKSTARTWEVRPVNAAKETDLYMIDVSEIEEDIEATKIETTFATIEDAAAPVIRRMLTEEFVPEGEDREKLVAFLSVLAMRVPSRLRWIDDILRKPVEMMYRRLEAEGKFEEPGDPEVAKKMKEWFNQGLIRIDIKQNARLSMMIATLPTLMRLLMERTWTLLRTKPDAGDLVTMDQPVLLKWIKPVPDGMSPGFELKNTAVFVPLGPEAALLGLWDAAPKEHTLTASQVTSWNGELLGQVDRFVFSRGDFSALHRTGAVDRREEVVGRWAQKQPGASMFGDDEGRCYLG
jgi:hypothetical protein